MKRSKEKAEELLGVSGFHRLQNELTKETVNHLDEQMSLETETNENVHNSDHLIEVYNEAYDTFYKQSGQMNSDRAHEFAITAVMLESNPPLTGGHWKERYLQPYEPRVFYRGCFNEY